MSQGVHAVCVGAVAGHAPARSCRVTTALSSQPSHFPRAQRSVHAVGASAVGTLSSATLPPGPPASLPPRPPQPHAPHPDPGL